MAQYRGYNARTVFGFGSHISRVLGSTEILPTRCGVDPLDVTTHDRLKRYFAVTGNCQSVCHCAFAVWVGASSGVPCIRSSTEHLVHTRPTTGGPSNYTIVTVAVSVAVCEIFSVKEWRDLENQVRGRSRSLKMAPFDRPHTTFYWSAIVNIALSCTIFKLYDVE